MNKKRTSNQLSPIELLKDIVIVLLLCSAVFLLWEAQLLVGLITPLTTEVSNQPTEVQVYQIQAEAARPIRMAAITGDDILYGIQYDDQLVDALFQESSTLLREALGSLDAPTAITESQWQTLLSTAPGLYFDMLGDVPLSVLSGWLSGQENETLTAIPRRLLLTTMNDTVALCYQVGEDSFYCSTTQVVDVDRLWAVVEQCASNDARFAFQMESYSMLDPYTLLSNTNPTPHSYMAENPIFTAESRDEFLAMLGIDTQLGSTYTTTDGLGIVLRNDSETLRIYGSGIVTYETSQGLSSYPVTSSYSQPTVFDVVESCRSVATNAIIPFCGDARLHLLSVTEEDGQWTVTFAYSLNGIIVQFSDGSEAAQFVVENDEITEFTLRLRNYIQTEELSTPLPQFQAASAMTSLGYQGQELILSYYDSGANRIFADWAASNR